MANVLATRQIREAATPLRDGLDKRGINRNYCIGTVLAVAAGAVLAIVSVLQAKGACYDPCPAAEQPDQLSCNCEKAKWGMSASFGGFAVFIFIYEMCTHEGQREMVATQARAAYMTAPEV